MRSTPRNGPRNKNFREIISCDETFQLGNRADAVQVPRDVSNQVQSHHQRFCGRYHIEPTTRKKSEHIKIFPRKTTPHGDEQCPRGLQTSRLLSLLARPSLFGQRARTTTRSDIVVDFLNIVRRSAKCLIYY